MRSRHGVTVLELLLVVVLLAGLTAVAGPGLTRWHMAARLRLARDQLLTSLDHARLHAIRLGVPVTLDLSVGPPHITASWRSDTLTLTPTRPFPPGVTLHGGGAPIVFSPAGVTLGVANRTLTLRAGPLVRTVVLSRLGRITVPP